MKYIIENRSHISDADVLHLIAYHINDIKSNTFAGLFPAFTVDIVFKRNAKSIRIVATDVKNESR